MVYEASLSSMTHPTLTLRGMLDASILFAQLTICFSYDIDDGSFFLFSRSWVLHLYGRNDIESTIITLADWCVCPPSL